MFNAYLVERKQQEEQRAADAKKREDEIRSKRRGNLKFHLTKPLYL